MTFQSLKESNIFIWGAGKLGGELLERLKGNGISVRAFCDSNTAIVEKQNITVLTPVQLKREMDSDVNSILIICVGSSIVWEVWKQVEQLQIFNWFTHREIYRILDKNSAREFYEKEQCQCCGCNACVEACPYHSIAMEEDEEGFRYPMIDEKTCIHCNICEQVCPIINEKHKGLQRNVLIYAAMTKNQKTRDASTSGGLFTEFAEFFIKKKGVVFGAVFDSNMKVIHDYADNLDKLRKMRGSKYVESDVSNTYEIAKSFLEEGRLVMYTGTPCQIGGLYSYLGKEYENLFTQDFICHGVPSPKVWKKYLSFREKEEGYKVVNASFRGKETGWKQFVLSLKYSNGITQNYPAERDEMLVAFSQNLSLRPSCYACSFKEKNRQSDITIGDFWGIEYVLREMDDDKGTSILFINSPKGEKVYLQILDNLKSEPVDPLMIRFFNPCFIHSVSIPDVDKRKEFFKSLDS